MPFLDQELDSVPLGGRDLPQGCQGTRCGFDRSFGGFEFEAVFEILPGTQNRLLGNGNGAAIQSV